MNVRSHNETLSKRIIKLKKFVARHGRLPSYSEMCQLFDLASKNAIFRIVSQLLAMGILKKDGSQLAATSAFYALPLLGSIRAGQPSPTDVSLDDQFLASRYTLKHSDGCFALIVAGDSMIGAGICEGDTVTVDSHKSPKDGDVVAALIDGAWTLKYFRQTVDGIRLEAANPVYSPLLPQNELIIGGVVVQVTRLYYR